MTTSKDKGDLLEAVIEQLCSGIENAKVSRNAKIIGRNSKVEREIDILILGNVGLFDVKIVIEAKNYEKPVGVEKVESLVTKLRDVDANLGAMVCPKGFYESAKNLAYANSIQLFEVFDPTLGNCDLFIPLRYVEANIKSFSFEIRQCTKDASVIIQDVSRWRIHIGNKLFDARQLVIFAWNNEMLPHHAGQYKVDFKDVAISDNQLPDKPQCFDLILHIEVAERYLLKLFPASFMKNLENQKELFKLNIDLYSKDGDMLKNGWKEFPSLEEMNSAANIDNQPTNIRNLIIRPYYTMDIDKASAEDLEQ